MPLGPDHPAAIGDGSPLTVLVLNDFATVTGGSDRVALAEAAGLARRGHRVTLVAGHGEPDPGLLASGVTVRTTGQPTTLGDPRRIHAAARGLWNPTSARLVRELTAGNAGPAVVHVHGFTKVLSASVVRAAADSGVRVVATLHDYFVACPNGGFFNYPREELCTLRPLSARCVATNCDARAYSHKLWRVGRSVAQRWPGQVPSGISDFIAPSREAAIIVQRSLPSAARIHVVPNPVAVDRAPPADPSMGVHFAFVGRLARDKGAVTFARAARQAGVQAVFVGAGDDADAVRSAYPRAELTGWLAPENVQRVVRGARAVVNPSLIQETQGLSALEAAACGVPAVVSDVSVSREEVADGVSGLWFRSGDERDLAAKLTRLANDPGLALRLGRAAYERFWSKSHGLATHLDHLEAVYRGVFAERVR